MENFDFKKIIIGSITGVIISLVIGVILFWLTFATVKSYDAGVFSAGYTEFSFVIGVLIAAIIFGLKQNDIISAGITGFIIALLTTLLEGFVLKLFWDPMRIQYIMGYWGNHAVILIFVGIVVSIGFNQFFQKKIKLK